MSLYAFGQGSRSIEVRPFRIGLYGCNHRGLEWFRAAYAEQRFEVVAVADPDLERARLVAAELEVSDWYESLEEMADRHELEGVIVVRPLERDWYPVLDALELQLNVLCVPLGPTEGVQLWIDAAARSNRVLAVDYERPAQVAWSLQKVGRGAIGTPLIVEATWVSPGAGEELGAQLAVGLPLLGSRPKAVSAVRAGDSMHATVVCENGAVGLFSSFWSELVPERERWIRAVGTAGSIEVPLPEDDFKADLCRPAITKYGRDLELGEVPLLPAEARVQALEDWAAASRRLEEQKLSRPADALGVQRVYDAIRTSAVSGGKKMAL